MRRRKTHTIVSDTVQPVQPSTPPTAEPELLEANTTPPHPETRSFHFEIAMNPVNGSWHWMLWASNGRAIATNAYPYAGQNEARLAIHKFVEICRTRSMEILSPKNL